MITTNNKELYEKLKKYRDENFKKQSLSQELKMSALLLAAYLAFFKPFYGITNFLERRTKVLDPIAKYYKEDEINMPGDFLELLPSINARMGSIQLDKYDELKKGHRAIADFYNKALEGLKGITAPPLIDGAAYLYCVSMVNDRKKFIEYMRKKGVQIGEYIEYAIPYMKAYEKHRNGDYPNAYKCSRGIVNLPCHPALSEGELSKIAGLIAGYFK